MVDRGRVAGLLGELDGYIKELREMLPQGAKQYPDIRTQRAVERVLQLCVEVCIDICKKLVIGLRLGVPMEEADVFDKLEKASVVSSRTVVLLKRMRRMRNVLVHEYVKIDDAIVLDAVNNRLGDFETFKSEVLAYLNK